MSENETFGRRLRSEHSDLQDRSGSLRFGDDFFKASYLPDGKLSSLKHEGPPLALAPFGAVTVAFDRIALSNDGRSYLAEMLISGKRHEMKLTDLRVSDDGVLSANDQYGGLRKWNLATGDTSVQENKAGQQHSPALILHRDRSGSRSHIFNHGTTRVVFNFTGDDCHAIEVDVFFNGQMIREQDLGNGKARVEVFGPNSQFSDSVVDDRLALKVKKLDAAKNVFIDNGEVVIVDAVSGT